MLSQFLYTLWSLCQTPLHPLSAIIHEMLNNGRAWLRIQLELLKFHRQQPDHQYQSRESIYLFFFYFFFISYYFNGINIGHTTLARANESLSISLLLCVLVSIILTQLQISKLRINIFDGPLSLSLLRSLFLFSVGIFFGNSHFSDLHTLVNNAVQSEPFCPNQISSSC